MANDQSIRSSRAKKTNHGDKWGRLTAIEPDGLLYGCTAWRFRCDCGKDIRKLPRHVRSGNTTSCGCLSTEVRESRFRKHGMAYNPEYRAWASMRSRCNDKKLKCYKNYGGRGIVVCERWKDFAAFYADMGQRPTPKHSLDRIDVNGNYEPSNCRWATLVEQARNKRVTLLVTAFGKTQSIHEWCKEYGLLARVVRDRIVRAGWSAEKALETPVCSKNLASQTRELRRLA